jgi:gamma-glutamyltranspeptidase/glutathione hydrolase
MSPPFSWSAGYASQRAPVFARNVVSTSHPLAAQTGLRMLLRGGNAVDAAIAAAAVMTIVEPCSNGLGSDAFCIVWDGQQLQGLNASGVAPAGWTPEYFKGKYGPDTQAPPKRGWDSVTVPGAVAGWVALHGRYGRLPFADLLAPAIEIAERGYAVPLIVQQKWQNAAALPEITTQPGFAEAFLPRGRAPEVGARFTLPDAARTLRLIALTTGEAFYCGEVAAAAEAHAKAHGGVMRADDFANYLPEWVTPIARDYRGHTLHEIPPNGQGIAALIALGILDQFDLAGLPVDGTASQHLQIEAMKLAFADVYRYVAEPRSMRLTPEQMLDAGYLASRAKLIDPHRAQDYGPGHAPKGGTIYLTAADERGMMVSFIQSNYMGFGSGVVVPGYGLSLQNRGHGFTLDPTSDNLVGPGKRPFHTIIPAFLTKDGQPVMSLRRDGWRHAAARPLADPGAHAGLPAAPAGRLRRATLAFCRWQAQWEAGMPAATVQGLMDLGHRVDSFADSYQDFGAGQFIWRLGDPAVEGYVAASDPRRDGQAAGY